MPPERHPQYAHILTSLLSCTNMPSCLKCGAALAVNEEGVAPVLCDRCAGVATGRARRTIAVGGLSSYPVTAGLMAVNIVVFILELVPGLEVKFWGANIGPLTITGQYWRLFTAGFLHGDILHIALNMWCLWSLGRLSERLFGRWQTFAIYMVTGVGGALLSIASKPEHSELGASGAIFGIVGAVMAGVKFGDLNISAGEKRAIFSSVVSFAVINFVLGASSVGMFANVDNMCHLGGFVTGLLIGLPMGAFARRNKNLQVVTLLVTSAVLFAGAHELVQTHKAASAYDIAQKAAQAGDYLTAAEYMEVYAKDNPGDAQALSSLGMYYVFTNQRDKAIDAFQRALTADPSSNTARQAIQELRAPAPPQTK
jgi:membrane associated rhomboid family serine protease